MKAVRIFALALASAVAFTVAETVPQGTHEAAQSSSVATLQGQGILDFLACGSCLGSGGLAMSTGWVATWTAVMRVHDGALASACVDACIAAF